MGRWGFGCIHLAGVEGQPSATTWVGPGGWEEGDVSVGLRSRRHDGEWGWVDAAELHPSPNTARRRGATDREDSGGV